MKIRALLLIVPAFLSVTARGDLTIVQKVEGYGWVKQVTLKLKGDKTRVEVSPEVTTIIDNKSGETLNLMNGQRKFLRISAERSRAIAELANRYGGDSLAATEKPNLTPTGKKEMLNGYETEEYVRASSAAKESHWIALKFPDSAAILKQLQTIAPAAWNDVTKGMFDYRELPGFPLRTTVKADGRKITSTVISIKQDPLSEAEFSVPKDFQELTVPNRQETSSGKAPITPATKP